MLEAYKKTASEFTGSLIWSRTFGRLELEVTKELAQEHR
jgi:hypothetical protein